MLKEEAQEALKKFSEHPIQTAIVISESTGVYRTTLTRACVSERLGKAAYRSGDVWLIDTSHDDFQKWFDAYWEQSRVKGEQKKVKEGILKTKQNNVSL